MPASPQARIKAETRITKTHSTKWQDPVSVGVLMGVWNVADSKVETNREIA
jgi:hypothetical protein